MSEILENFINLFNLGNLNPKTVGLFVTAIIIIVIVIVTVPVSASTSGKQNSMRMMALGATAPVKQIFLQTDPDGNLSTFDFATTPIDGNISSTGNITANGKLCIGNTCLTENDLKNIINGKFPNLCIGNTCLTENDLKNIINGKFPNLSTNYLTTNGILVDKSQGDWSQAITIRGGSKEAPYIDFLKQDGTRNGIIMMAPQGELTGYQKLFAAEVNATNVNATGKLNALNVNNAFSQLSSLLKSNQVVNAGNSINNNGF